MACNVDDTVFCEVREFVNDFATISSSENEGEEEEEEEDNDDAEEAEEDDDSTASKCKVELVNYFIPWYPAASSGSEQLVGINTDNKEVYAYGWNDNKHIGHILPNGNLQLLNEVVH